MQTSVSSNGTSFGSFSFEDKEMQTSLPSNDTLDSVPCENKKDQISFHMMAMCLVVYLARDRGFLLVFHATASDIFLRQPLQRQIALKRRRRILIFPDAPQEEPTLPQAKLALQEGSERREQQARALPEHRVQRMRRPRAMRWWNAGSGARRTSQTVHAIGAVDRHAGSMRSKSHSTRICATSATQHPSNHRLSWLPSHWHP